MKLFIVSTQNSSLKMSILGARAPWFHLVSGFSYLTSRGITMQELADWSLVAYSKFISAKQGGFWHESLGDF